MQNDCTYDIRNNEEKKKKIEIDFSRTGCKKKNRCLELGFYRLYDLTLNVKFNEMIVNEF